MGGFNDKSRIPHGFVRNLPETQTRVTSFLSQRCKPSFRAFWRSSVRLLFWSETAASAGWKLPPPPCRWAPSPRRQEPRRDWDHYRDRGVRGASKHSGTSRRGRIVRLMSRLCEHQRLLLKKLDYFDLFLSNTQTRKLVRRPTSCLLQRTSGYLGFQNKLRSVPWISTWWMLHLNLYL